MKHKLPALFMSAAFGLGGTAFAGTTWHVANNGLDSNTCGATDPCRSISRAIAVAQPMDQILVGPGRYGELDRDDTLGGFGVEAGGAGAGIHVNKPVAIYSTAGAGATLIDVAGTVDSAVAITSNGVIFGDRNRGFTLVGGRLFGLTTSPVTNVLIGGNVASKHTFAGFLVSPSGQVEMRGNTAVGNLGTGFSLGGDSSLTASVLFTGNVARDNQTGLSVGSPANHRVLNNEIIGNDTGMLISYGNSRIANNYVAGNRLGAMVNSYSLDFPPQAPTITRNSFVGNRANGLDVFPGPPGVVVALRENNFYGNFNCGVTNQTSIGGSTPVNVDARRNYWGAPTGPSFNEPADPACAFSGGAVLTSPFATSEFAVR